MGFFNRLHRDYLWRKLLPVPFLAAATVALFFLFSGPEALRSLRPVPLASLSPAKWEGTCVVYDVPYIYAQYMRELEYRGGVNTGRCVGGGYLIDLERDGTASFRLLGLYIHGDRALLEQAEELARRSRETDAPAPMRVWGTVRMMEEEERAQYNETIKRVSDAYGGSGRAEGLEDRALPLYIDAGRIDGKPAWLARGLLVLSLIPLLLAVWWVVQALRIRPLRPLQRKLEELGGGETLDALLESFYEETEPIGGVRVGRDFVLLPGYLLLRPWEIVWAYREGGLCVLRTLDGQRYELPLRSEEAQAVLDEILQLLPGTAVGYTDQLARRYQEDRASFAGWWDQCRPGCYQEVIEERKGRVF